MGSMGAPSDPRLYVFHPSGGALVPQTFSDVAASCSLCTNQAKIGHVALYWVNLPEVGTSESEATAFIVSLPKGVCQALNDKNGIGMIPEVSSIGLGTFIGSTSSAPMTVLTTSTTEDLDAIKGKGSFCYHETYSPYRYNYLFTFKEY